MSQSVCVQRPLITRMGKRLYWFWPGFIFWQFNGAFLINPKSSKIIQSSTCLNPKQFTNGNSTHGIMVEEDNTILPFNMYGCISYLPIRTPTPDEMNRCRHILLSSEELWSPYDDSFTQSENSHLPPHHRTLGATSRIEHRSSVPPALLAQCWGTSLDITSKTLKVTTQRGIRPLTRRFRTRQSQLQYPHL
jgi:hypothetical protein